jgi:hypothetical protein
MDYQSLFSSLNKKLKQNNLTLEVHCVGGFVLEYYGLKATDDIDAFYQSSALIEQLIAEVGAEFQVGTADEAWLNHSVGRAKDIPDIAKIMKVLKIRKPDKIFQMMQYSNGETDPAIILEAYSLAYGEESLRAYLQENPELLRLLR